MDRRPTEIGSRAVLWLAAVAILVVIVALAIIAAMRSPADFDAGSPEAAAQSYLQALLDGDERSAHEHLSLRLQEECSITEIRNAWLPESVRVTLTETVVAGDTAEVELIMIEGSSDPFGGGTEYDVTLVLTRAADGWLISEPPWPIEHCRMEGF
jgi:hypothetical protein